MTEITVRLADVFHRLRVAELTYHREPGTVRLLAISKYQPSEAIRTAFAAGQHAFGESYLQEALDKQTALRDLDIGWHFVGALQANKTREVAAHFSWVHSVERAKTAIRLSEHRPAHLPPLNLCLQVNISGEKQKAGCAPEALPELAATVAELPNVRLRGLMTLPAPADDFDAQRRPFAALRGHYEALRQQGFALDTLSMGMSNDLEAAIAEGATFVRVGTAIFGPRPPSPEPRE